MKILIVGLALMLMFSVSFAVDIEDIVKPLASQTVILAGAGTPGVTVSVQFLFPRRRGTSGNVVMNGFFNLAAIPTELHVSANTDSIQIYAREVHLISGSYLIAAGDSIPLASFNDWNGGAGAVNWTSGSLYSFPTTSAFGPCDGLQIYVNYWGEGANDDVQVELIPKVY